MPSANPLPNDDRSPAQPPELETLRAIYDRRRRKLRIALACGLAAFVLLLGVAAWLFVRFPLRAVRQHERNTQVRELAAEVGQDLREGNDDAAAEAIQKQLALIDRNKEPLLWVRIAGQAAGQFYSAKRYREAHAILDDALPWAEKHPALGPDALETVRLVGSLASLEGEEGHDKTAEALFQRAIATSERVFGEEARITLMALNDYGWFLLGRSRLDEAEPPLMRSVAGMEKTGRGNTSSMASVLDSVAHLRDQQGRLDEAIELQRRAVEIGRKIFSGQETYFKKFTTYLAELEARAQAAPAQK